MPDVPGEFSCYPVLRRAQICKTHEENEIGRVCPEEDRVLHPITHEFLSKAKEYDRSRQREVCQLRNRLKASGSTSPSKIQEATDLLRFLLLHAGKHLREAMFACRTWVCERSWVEG